MEVDLDQCESVKTDRTGTTGQNQWVAGQLACFVLGLWLEKFWTVVFALGLAHYLVQAFFLNRKKEKRYFLGKVE